MLLVELYWVSEVVLRSAAPYTKLSLPVVGEIESSPAVGTRTKQLCELRIGVLVS